MLLERAGRCLLHLCSSSRLTSTPTPSGTSQAPFHPLESENARAVIRIPLRNPLCMGAFIPLMHTPFVLPSAHTHLSYLPNPIPPPCFPSSASNSSVDRSVLVLT